MSDLRNSQPKELPAGMTRQPVKGQIKGTYSIGTGEVTPFDFTQLVYVGRDQPPYTYLEGRSADAQLQLIIFGPLSIEEPGYYQISDDLQQLEAQFYVSNGGYIGYEPAHGGLSVRFVTPEGGHKRIEGDASFNLRIEDSHGDWHDSFVNIERIDFKTSPV